MARIAGVELPVNKRVEVALTYIKGVGLATSRKVLKMTGVDLNLRTDNLTDDQVKIITNAIEKNYTVEGNLTQTVNKNIRRLKDIKCYRGVRHKLGLPVRGQRTKSNAVTRKGKNLAVGGLKLKISKT